MHDHPKHSATRSSLDSPADLQSYSSPNLARLRQSQHHLHHSSRNLNDASNAFTSSTAHTGQYRSIHLVPHDRRRHETENAHDGNSSDDKEDGNTPGKMSRSERKRMWRKNLSADKLAKLRERDAMRKRVERMNMSAEKKKDLRSKDTARKAALRRERRKTETTGGYGGSTDLPNDLEDGDDGILRGTSSGNVHAYNGRPQEHGGERSARGRVQRSEVQSGGSRRAGYTKIPVHTLLN